MRKYIHKIAGCYQLSMSESYLSKLRHEWVILYHRKTRMWLLIHVRISVNPSDIETGISRAQHNYMTIDAPYIFRPSATTMLGLQGEGFEVLVPCQSRELIRNETYSSFLKYTQYDNGQSHLVKEAQVKGIAVITIILSNSAHNGCASGPKLISMD